MIYGLTPVQAAQKIVGNLAKIEVNALLQLGIEVLKRQNDGTFLIKMGQHTFTTKSETALEPGREYWVEMQQSKEGIVHLKRPMPKPLLFKAVNHTAFEPGFLERLAREEDPASALKEQLLQALAAAPSKEQFQTLTQLLLSLHQGILSIPLRKSGKKMLLQMRKRGQNGSLNQKSVEFYAAMNNIGPLSGTIVQRGHQKDLRLELHYPKSVRLLKERSAFLKGFENVDIGLAPAPVKPFWETEQPGLLDIKG
ncbi:hypothetical protein [Hydrogenimonas cancrithermarum]|uniref:Uncharacterized protein n=1 Tax=Hydrogenimonas cancrithermarum TaxID=2993563 RepID=A0ABN6WT19_9BACT|nr:hypothetical protein [Hydrogenimonas cancrithermarum]BDY12214.1 hypothetical protein HCR_05260 [Hydrogenimonas cancrithermarum]